MCAVITHGGTLPDDSAKTDFYSIIDNAAVSAIVNADISASASILDTKLAQLTTALKVAGTSLTGLSSIPSAAGVIPATNLPYGGGGLRAWVDKSSSYAAQQATTDGLVIGYLVPYDSTSAADFYTDSTSNPTTIRQKLTNIIGNVDAVNFCMPVRKSDYWKMVVTGSAYTTTVIYWIPLGA